MYLPVWVDEYAPAGRATSWMAMTQPGPRPRPPTGLGAAADRLEPGDHPRVRRGGHGHRPHPTRPPPDPTVRSPRASPPHREVQGAHRGRPAGSTAGGRPSGSRWRSSSPSSSSSPASAPRPWTSPLPAPRHARGPPGILDDGLCDPAHRRTPEPPPLPATRHVPARGGKGTGGLGGGRAPTSALAEFPAVLGSPVFLLTSGVLPGLPPPASGGSCRVPRIQAR